MALKPERIEVGDRVFFARKPPPFDALKNFGDLQKLLASPLAKLDVDGVLDDLSGIGMASVMRVVTELSAVLDGATMDRIVRMLLNPKYVSVVTDDPTMPEQLTDKVSETVFTDIAEMIELAVKVALYTYSGVFTRGQRLLGEARSKMASSQSVSSPTAS